MGRPKKVETLPRVVLNVAFSTPMHARLRSAATKRSKIFDREVSMNELVREAVSDFLRTEETSRDAK